MALTLSSLLPGGDQAKITEKLTLTQSDQKKDVNRKYTLNMQFAELILRVALETAEAIMDSRYKQFDALVKNFGCQMTALEVFQKMSQRREALSEEAGRIQKAAQERLDQIPSLLSNPPFFEEVKSRGIIFYREKAGLDIEISEEFAKLLRFRLLCIVNGVINKEGREAPCTNTGNLSELLPLIAKENLRKFVEDIQIEESGAACAFIRAEGARQVALGKERSALALRLLGDRFKKRDQNGIVSLPCLYNTEVSMKGVEGIVLIKNKLFFCGERREGAEEIKIFMAMPEQRILSSEEVRNIPDHQPLFVVEGYIRNKFRLENMIRKQAFLTIINANAKLTDGLKGLKDIEAQADHLYFFELNRIQKITSEVFEIDHVFCASMKEEKNENTA